MAELLKREETLCDRNTGARCKRAKKCWRYQNPDRSEWEGDFFSEAGKLDCDGFTPMPQTKDPEKVEEDKHEVLAEIRESLKD